MSENQRNRLRVPISEPVRVRYETWEDFQIENADNISEGGIFIQTSDPLSPGETFDLEIDVSGEKIQAKAVVIWTKEFSDSESRPSGMGARFLEMSEAGKTLLSRYVQSHGED